MSLAHAPTLAECVALLEARRVALCEELHGFVGGPVPACDVEFNALLAERAEVVAALARLTPLARAEAKIAHPRED